MRKSDEIKRRSASCNPFKLRRDEKDSGGRCEVPLVEVIVKTETVRDTQPLTSFLFEDRALESSEVALSISPHALKLFEAIREDEIDLVEEKLSSLTDKRSIDETSGPHGFALIHVAAKYNFGRIVNTLVDHGADINIRTSEDLWTPLHLAARFNGVGTIVDVLLPRGADPSFRGKNGSTPLHLAARGGNDEIVTVLLDHPSVEVDAKNDSGKTALHLACSEGHSKVCEILLNFGADIKVVSADKMTPLHIAILNGHSEVGRMILKRAADRDVEINVKELLGEEDLQGNTVLHMAAWNNDVKTAQLCLDIGADVNTLKCNSASALHLAATKGNLEMADLLISRGAGVNTKDKDSKTPLQRAALFNQTKLIEFLVEKEAKVDVRDDEGRSPFLNAVAAGHVDSARLLLNLGADISATDLFMKTCVHIAVENEHLKMLSMLLGSRAGANNLNKADLWNRVPLHYAAKTKEIKILKLVLSKQKRLSFRDENHKTPLHLAAEQSSFKHVEVLAKRKSNVNARDELGRTPLHTGAGKGQRKTCMTLLNMGAEVDSRDNDLRTPLMWAAKRNQLKCAEILLDFKASTDLQDVGGYSALHVACGHGHNAIVSLLLDRGASLTLVNKEGFACLEIAEKTGSSDVAMAIVKHRRWKELEEYQTSNGQSAISLLIENFPEAAEVVLNQCVHHSDHLSISDPDYTVTYNFQYIDPDPDVKMPSGRFSAIQTMIKHKHERLLLHPLTLKFNERKWDRLGRYVYMFDFGTYLILMVLFTIAIVQQKKDEDRKREMRIYRDDIYMDESDEWYFMPVNRTRPIPYMDTPVNRTSPISYMNTDNVFEQLVRAMFMVFTFLHMCKEFRQIYVQRWKYFKDISSYLNWALYISAALYMLRMVDASIGIVAIFMCYVNMILFLRRYRLFGTYISMYVEVTRTVFQVMVVFFFLLFGFTLVFYLIFYHKTAFATEFHSLLSVLVMMIGELDYAERVEDRSHLLVIVAFFCCFCLLSIALMNLMVGLAVGDIETMRKQATIKRLGMQLEYLIEIEESYPKFIIRAVYQVVHVEKPNKKHRLRRVMERHQAKFSEVSSEPTTEKSQQSELADLKTEMMKTKKKVESIDKLIRALAVTIDPKIKLPEETEDQWEADRVDGGMQASSEAQKESEQQTDDTGVELGRGEKSADALFDSGL